MTGIILAGGDSKRMGQNKAFLELCDKYVIEWVIEKIKMVSNEIIIVTDKPWLYSEIPGKKITDQINCKGKNPLVGIFSGLSISSNEYNLAVACDMPFLSTSMIEAMYNKACKGGYEIVVPCVEGHHEPLCAIYRRDTRFLMKSWVEEGKYKIPDLYEEFENVKFLPEEFCRYYDPELYSFFNLNYPSDLDKARELCS